MNLNIRGPRDPRVRDQIEAALEKPLAEWTKDELNWAGRVCVEILRATDDVGRPPEAGAMNLALDVLFVITSETSRRAGIKAADIPWRDEFRRILKNLASPPKPS